MKEKIILIVLLVSIILIILLANVGFKLGNFEILSVSGLKKKNTEVNDQINTVSQITSTEYPAAVKQLEDTTDSLKVQKEKYEQLAGFSEGEDEAYVTEKYDIAYLWTEIGKMASKQKIGLVMDVAKSSGTNYYDLNFSVTGEYVHISQFISALENDSDFAFRIYNFKMQSGSASFTVKDVNIDDSTLITDGSDIQVRGTEEETDQSTNANNTTTSDDNLEDFKGEEKTQNGTTFEDLNQ